MYGMAAALLAGCSSTDDDVLSPEASSEDINAAVDVSKLMSDVPIEFGTFGGDAYNMTRGSFDETIDRTIEDVRVFCLARKTIKTGVTEKRPITWSGQSPTPEYNILGVWQNNVKARIEPTDNLNRGQLTWDDPTEPHFYPSKAWYSYAFVAYHPSADTIEYNSSNIKLTFKFDGDEDVLIAKANDPTDKNELAYSSFYFKEVAKPDKPFFAFKHLAAKLVFTFQLKKDESNINESNINLYVDSVAIKGFPNEAYTRIYRNDATGEVTVAPVLYISYPSSRQGDYWLREQDDSSIRILASKYRITKDEPVVVGDGIMIPPVPAGSSYSTPKLWVWLKDDSGNIYTSGQAITVPCPDDGWIGGKQYNINVKLNSLVNMSAEARVTGWSEISEPEEIEAVE